MTEVSGLEIVWVLLGGVLSGILNTLASSGSAVTLPLLVFVGLHPSVANATNRIGIVAGAVTSTMMFHKEGLLDLKQATKVCVWPWLGTIGGAVAATHITDDATQLTIMIAVVLAFILILVGSKRFLKEVEGEPRAMGPGKALRLLAVGFWAGFIVLDSATYLLLALVLGLNYSLKHANAVKPCALLGIALLSVLVFWGHHQLDWLAGLLLAAGNVVGAAIGARAAILPNADVWVYRLLVTVVSLELLKMGYDYFG